MYLRVNNFDFLYTIFIDSSLFCSSYVKEFIWWNLPVDKRYTGSSGRDK